MAADVGLLSKVEKGLKWEEMARNKPRLKFRGRTLISFPHDLVIWVLFSPLSPGELGNPCRGGGNGSLSPAIPLHPVLSKSFQKGGRSKACRRRSERDYRGGGRSSGPVRRPCWGTMTPRGSCAALGWMEGRGA